MTQEEKQLLFQDLCARLPYGVVVRCTDSDTDYICFLTTDILHEIQNGHEHYDYKPYLRPMSSMTKDEKATYSNYKIVVRGLGIMFEYNLDFVTEWLLKHHFDYRGLIEKGLALEASEGMYNTKTE